MAKSNKDIPQEFQDLKDTLNNYNNYIKNDIKNVVTEIQNEYKQLFDMEEDMLNEKLSSSEEMSQLYEAYLKKMSDINNSIKEYGNKANQLFLEYGISGENLSKFFKRLDEYKKIKEALKQNKEEFNLMDNNTQNSQNGLNLMGKIINQEEQIKRIENSFTTIEKKLLYDYETQKNPLIEETLENYKAIVDEKEKLNQLEEKGIDLNKRYNEEQKKTAKVAEAIRAVWRGIVSVLSLGYEKWKEIDETVFTIGRSAGVASEQLREYQKNVMNNYDNMASTYGMTFKELFAFQEKYIKNTGRAIILSNEQVETLAGLSKLIGENATNEMVKNMDDFGASTNTASDYLAVNMYKAKLYGLDATKASEDLAKNVKMASKYNFSEGINGISKMTLMSQRLKFNMESIGNSLEKFETIESSIETAANIQMLGGSFAANFSNPLTVMGEAALDAEAFTQRIVDTVSDKAYFNRQTGVVEMSPLDKRFLKEFAKSIGLSYDEVWNIATQKTKENELKPQLRGDLTEDEKLFIINKAQFNKDLNRHELTYLKNGETQTIDIKEVNSDLVKEIRKQDNIDKSIQGDVQGIHNILKAKVLKDVGETKTYNEMVKGLKESAAINIADIEDGPLNWFKSGLGWLSSSNMWGTAAGVMLASQFKPFFSKWVDKKIVQKAAKGITSKGKGLFNFGRKTVPKVANAKNVKMLSKIPGIGKWVAGAAIATAAIWGGSKLLSSNPTEQNTEIAQNSDSILTELKIHTELLRVISQRGTITVRGSLGGVSNSMYTVSNSVSHPSNYNSYSVVNNGNEEDTFGVGDLFDRRMFMGLGDKYIKKKGSRISARLRVASKKFGNKSVSKLMSNVGAKAIKPKGGALGLASMGTDFVNDIGKESGWWKEGSGVDNTLSVGSKALEYAGWGSMIGSIVPGVGTALGAGIGAVLGGVVGTIQQYKKNKENEEISNENITDLEKNAYIATIGIYENIEALRNEFLLANESYSYNGNPYQGSNAMIESRIVSSNFVYDDRINSNKSNEIVEIKNENLNLNINGTLRLTSNNNDVNIDMKELLNNPQIKNQIIDIVYQGLNQRANQGRGYNKNAYTHQQGRITVQEI